LKFGFSGSRLSLNGLAARFSRFSTVKALGAVFLFGFLVRLVPEVLAFSSPIGWDQVYYAVVMKNGVVWANWAQFFTSTWLLYAVTVPLHAVTGIDPFVLLKVVAPALYGLTVAGVYWFGSKLLRWDVKMCLVAVGLFAFQLASLRVSWDLLRNTLGMGLLLFTLPLVERVGSKGGFMAFAVLSLLTVFAHEYAAVTWVFVVLGLLVWRLVKGRFNVGSVRILLAGLPALAIFVVGMYLRFFPVRFEGAPSNVLSTGEVSAGKYGFMVNYLAVNAWNWSYASYWSLFYEVVLLFAFLYLPYLFLVWKGYFKNCVLNLWLSLLLVGAFGCLVVPFFALNLWARWMFLLVYPFTFYAVCGLFRIYRSSPKGGVLVGRAKLVAVAGLAVLFSLGCAYLFTPLLAQTEIYGVAPVDISVHFGAAPTVPYQDVEGVTHAMHWLDENMGNDSFVILHHALLPWGRLYLDKSRVMVEYYDNVDAAVNVGLDRGFAHAFCVWWGEPIGWYNFSLPQSFVGVQDFDRISVYVYEV
jgi:hypothetical protein